MPRPSSLLSLFALLVVAFVATPMSAALADDKPAKQPPTLEDKVTTAQEVGKTNAGNLDALWTLLAAFLVFFMQAGFALVECGFTRAKNACNIIMKNLMDFSLGSLIFWVVGFGLMFGATSGYFGTDNFAFDAPTEVKKLNDAAAVQNEQIRKENVELAKKGEELKEEVAMKSDSFGWAFLIFQTVFCATAATIVSGAMAERTKFSGYLIYSAAITAFVYPIFGSWAWGGLWAGGGWLEGLGSAFHDFAGSTVVHSIGGWCALAGAIVLGPRLGKYRNGKTMPIPGHNIPLAALGVFILWLGWFGFNPGSTTAVGDSGASFAYIAVTTNLAAAAGAFAAMLTAWITFKKPDPSFALNGALAGLVAITAGCDVMTPALAIVTGLVAGVIVVFSVLALDKLKIDDPVGAVSVHGVCGAWGTIAIGLFPVLGFGLYGGEEVTNGVSLMSQLIGVGAAFAWAFPVSFGIFYAIKLTVGLRVSEQEEMEGLDLHEHGMLAYPAGFVSELPTGSLPSGAPAAFSAPTPAPAKPVPVSQS